ncbi:MAG TPA: MOSC domain-containing protein [bacterium]|nr:MAG: MOSC domain protein [bacterium ADurb.Bin236]HOY63149.1 MOSC domain-containing protein [bacterium]HPI75705.1 MOSC domain-containing protein [bacterium]HPN94356.1 MOSC domain-containing protein [bacterium]
MANGRVTAVCSGAERGKGKTRVREAMLIAGAGLEGDGHARGGARQLSILSGETAKRLNEEHGLGAQPGDFAENILTEGLDFARLNVGDKLKIGNAVARITEIGKPEHGPNDFNFKGFAPLAKTGLFAEIIVGGRVKEGDAISRIESE